MIPNFQRASYLKIHFYQIYKYEFHWKGILFPCVTVANNGKVHQVQALIFSVSLDSQFSKSNFARLLLPRLHVSPDKGRSPGEVGHRQYEQLPVEPEVGGVEEGACSSHRLHELQDPEGSGGFILVKVAE